LASNCIGKLSMKIDFTINSWKWRKLKIVYLGRVVIQWVAGNFRSGLDTFCIHVCSTGSALVSMLNLSFDRDPEFQKQSSKVDESLGESCEANINFLDLDEFLKLVEITSKHSCTIWGLECIPVWWEMDENWRSYAMSNRKFVTF